MPYVSQLDQKLAGINWSCNNDLVKLEKQNEGERGFDEGLMRVWGGFEGGSGWWEAGAHWPAGGGGGEMWGTGGGGVVVQVETELLSQHSPSTSGQTF